MTAPTDARTTRVLDDPAVHAVHLRDATDDDLDLLSRELGLGLSKQEMGQVRDHFRTLGRDPRDVELEALAQSWSEHCCYKSSKPVLRRHVYGIHEERLLAREDAGVLPFDDDHLYVVAFESHNHPSAIEPYGGAATGVGGILRDVVCMGAQPVALVDPLFFGPPDLALEDLPEGTKHPRYLLNGVVAGIRDYGNRVGIPTVAGLVHFHPKFVTNCLVNVGCVGVMRREHLIHSAVGDPGDRYLLLGGRTGRDGIHGVTFASADLHAGSEEASRSAVQVGDPITKEPLIHVCLEANERGLLTGMKDLGGGGLSCATGEMALAAGLGAQVDLARVPTKEPGMLPWEIWVSESQERMLVTVRPDDAEAVLALAAAWDVEATDIGRVLPEPVVRATWDDTLIFDMESEFLYGGPEYERPRAPVEVPDVQEPPAPREDYGRALLELLATPNLASREAIVHQYDHEVRANTLLKPLQGKMGVASHGDATVLRPVAGSRRGLALTTDVNPNLTDLDPYWGSASAVDEAVRNLAAVGARLDCLADNLNLPNPERPDRMGRIEEAVRALGDGARVLGVPFVSGNVSMYNESHVTPIPPTPAILGVGIVEDVARVATTDLKAPDHVLYQVGNTRDEMGGSAWYQHAGARSTRVPRVDWDLLKRSADAVVAAIGAGEVAACHDIAQGGLAAALAEMAFGGDVGFRVDVQGPAVGFPDDVLLFSESNARWVVEARDPEALETRFRDAGVPLHRLGTTGGERLVVESGGAVRVDLGLAEARDAWMRGLTDLMG